MHPHNKELKTLREVETATGLYKICSSAEPKSCLDHLLDSVGVYNFHFKELKNVRDRI